MGGVPRVAAGYRRGGGGGGAAEVGAGAGYARPMPDAHPFAVTFRDDNPQATQRVGAYEQALDFAELVDRIVDRAEGRFHLKDALDRGSTAVAMRIAQAAGELAKGDRRTQYRQALRHATDCAAVLDILARRGALQPDAFEPARARIAALVALLAQLATR